jgi:hypothetical protein
VTALWEAIDVLTRRVDEIEKKIENNRVVYLRPPKN